MEFSIPSNQAVFSMPIDVHLADIDELNHVNNVVYLRWVQDVATAHWLKIAPPEIRERVLWVVMRHEIDYKSAATLNTDVIAYTWVGDSIGPRSDRYVVICDQQNGKVIAQAKTTWCMLDATSGKPKRIEEMITNLLQKKEAR